MATKTKFTKEEINAMKIQAMIQGLDPDTVINQMIAEAELKSNLVKETKNKTKSTKKSTGTKKKSSKTKVIGNENQTFTTKQQFLPVYKVYSKLPKNHKIKVNYDDHDIHYKDQFWGIPSRDVEYNVELITNPKLNRDAAELLSNGNINEMEGAYKGHVRYYKVVTYDSIPSHLKEIGYIRVIWTKGKMYADSFVNEPLLTRCHANAELVKKSLDIVANNIVATGGN